MPEKSSTIALKNGDQVTSYRVKSMTHEDLPQLMEIRRELKIHDVETCIDTWLTVDPEGINVVESEKGEVIGACCAIKNTDDLHFIGMYCIRPEYQGSGLGIHAWHAFNDRIGSSNCALNGVPGTLEYYRDKNGFSVIETDFMCQKNDTSDTIDPNNLSDIVPQGVTIESVQDCHLPVMSEYDFSVVGYDRRLALILSCQEENSRTFIAMKNDSCVGYGAIKLTCLGAGRVGPLYADDSAVAEALLKTLIMSMPHVTGLVMNTLSNNLSAKKFLKKLAVPLTQELTRMYTKKKISVDTKKIFALFDLNLTPF